MAHSRNSSTADQQAIDAASSSGVGITAAQLERWRQARLIPTPIRHGLGRGRGSTSRYQPDEVDYIVRFATHKPVRRMWRTPAALFALGFEVPETCLRASYAALFDALDDTLRRTTRSRDPIDQAEALAARQQASPGSAGRQRRRQRRQTYHQLKRSGFFEETTTFAGFEQSALINSTVAVTAPDDLVPDGLRELAADTERDVAAAAQQVGASLPMIDDPGYLDDLSRNFAAFSIDALRDAALTASPVELRIAHTCWRKLFGGHLPAPTSDDFPDEFQLLLPVLAYISLNMIRQCQQHLAHSELAPPAVLESEGENPS